MRAVPDALRGSWRLGSSADAGRARGGALLGSPVRRQGLLQHPHGQSIWDPVERRLALAFDRFDRAELRFCQALNRSCAVLSVRQLFCAVSWLGDGWFWYGLIALLPVLEPERGWFIGAQMLVTGFAGVLVYKLIKRHAVRERPFITHSVINCASAPLDRYSFPSGHTLHAVSFTLVLTYYVPEWAPFLVVAAGLIATSRIVLGLHYPTDVAAGAAIGGGLGLVSVQIAQEIALKL